MTETRTEKRLLERYSLSMTARIQAAADPTVDAVLELETRDVCSGGAFFSTEHGFPPGTPVRVEMILPTERFTTLASTIEKVLIQVEGTVLRSGSRGMAVRFDDNYRFCPAVGRTFEPEMTSGRAWAGAL